jgi:tetratricopeptide (TPR) repeat protein
MGSKWAGAGLVLLVLVAYLPAVQGTFLWDDPEYVSQNQALRSYDGLRQIWLEPGAVPQYYPLVFTSFWLEYHLWGLDPAGYHLINIFLHGLSAVLFWRVLSRLGVSCAWFAAAVFALHPVQVESVAWITERKNVISGLCYWAAMLAYFRFRPPEPGPGPEKSAWGWYLAALGLYLCALLSKTVTCSLPAVLVLLYWWKRDKVTVRDWVALLPFFVLGLALGLHTAWLEKHHVGAEGEAWSLSWVERTLIAGRALWFYVGNLVWPVNLAFIYPRWHIAEDAWWQYLFPAAAVAVLVILWLARERLGKGPLVACLCFAGTLLPALGFFDVYPMLFSFVADHFQYLACAALIPLLVLLGAKGLRYLGFAEVGITVTGGAVLVVLGVLTWRQCLIYADVVTLWTDTLEKNPGCFLAHFSLGTKLHEQGDFEEARKHYAAAVKIQPRDYPRARINLGRVLIVLERPDQARPHFEAVLEIEPNNAEAHLGLGTAFARQGKLRRAVLEFAKALHLNPRLAGVHYNWGLVLMYQMKPEEAICHLTADLQHGPWLAWVCAALGDAHVQAGSPEKALRWYRKAVDLEPNLAGHRFGLAGLLERLGKTRAAELQYQEAFRRDRQWPTSAYKLAWRRATHPDPRARDAGQALKLAQLVCEASRNQWPPALVARAAAYAELGRFEEAASAARQALSFLPNTPWSNRANEIQDRVRLYEHHRPFRDLRVEAVN